MFREVNSFAIWVDDVHPEKRSLGAADSHGDVYRGLFVHQRGELKVLRKFITELLGFGDDPALEGVGNSLVAAENLPHGGSGDAEGSGDLLEGYFFHTAAGPFSTRSTFPLE